MPRELAALSALVLAMSACTTVARPRAVWSDGLVVAMNLCTKNQTVQATNDAAGDRAFCGMETVVGTHIPKCVCRDEKRMESDREETQQYLRDAAATKQNIRAE